MKYFALDGNYGDATDMIVVDTSNWTTEDWKYVEEGDDEGRAQRAQDVIDWYTQRGTE